MIFNLEKKLSQIAPKSDLFKNYSDAYLSIKNKINNYKDNGNVFRKLFNNIKYNFQIKNLVSIQEDELFFKNKISLFEKYKNMVDSKIDKVFYESELEKFKRKISKVSLSVNDVAGFKRYTVFNYNSIFLILWNSLNLFLKAQNKIKSLIIKIENRSNALHTFERDRFRLLIELKTQYLSRSNQNEVLKYLENFEIEIDAAILKNEDYIKETKKRIYYLKEKIKIIIKNSNLLDRKINNQIELIKHDLITLESKSKELRYVNNDLIILENILNQMDSNIKILIQRNKIFSINKKMTKSYLSFNDTNFKVRINSDDVIETLENRSAFLNKEKLKEYDQFLLDAKYSLIDQIQKSF
jgi:hypothetical protein